MYDLVIIGGGPAGVAAGVYAARKKLKTALITDSFGGQSVESMGIENWIGTPFISGDDLAKNFENHLRQFEDEDLDIYANSRAEKIEKTNDNFVVIDSDENKFETRTVLVATGSKRRKLDVPGADEYENRGITYCASCDGPLFKDKDVVVIGGGNAGFESAAQLLAYTRSVTLLHKNDKFKADPVTVNKVMEHPKMTAYTNAVTKEVKGETMAQSIVYKDTATNEEHEIPAEGIFVEIGNIPATGFVADAVEMNELDQIKVDPKDQKTSTPGIWAAGDCTDTLYHQNNIAAGDGVRALEDLYLWLRAR
ncbi:MAG: FAD-dependent oxidoreductase [Candidatus Campbellbacteria bacterium]|nr:FAD-dependent oxidoreductase [Candidatus Campbellbacteria bacterium]